MSDPIDTPGSRSFTMSEEGLAQIRRRLVLRWFGILAVASTAVGATWSLGANRLALPVTATIMAIGLGIIARAMQMTIARARTLKVSLDNDTLSVEQEGIPPRRAKLPSIRRVIETKRGGLLVRTDQRFKGMMLPAGLEGGAELRQLLQSYRDIEKSRVPEWFGFVLWVGMILLMVLGVSAHKLGADWLAAPIGTVWTGVGLSLVAIAMRSPDSKRRLSTGALGAIFMYLGALYLRRAMGG